MVISVISTMTAHAFLAFTYVNPYACMVSDIPLEMFVTFPIFNEVSLFFQDFNGIGIFNAGE